MSPTVELHVVAAGPSTSVQGAPRRGMRRYGVPGSGPLDGRAHAIATAAVGASPDASAIEVGAGGATVEVDRAITVAVAGGGFTVLVGGRELGPWCVHTLRPGEQLRIAPGAWGSWCVLAVAGHLDVAPWQGTASTHVVSGLGGGVLRSGDRLRIRDARVEPDRDGPLAADPPVAPLTVRAVLGPQERHFVHGSVGLLSGSVFRPTPASDRMGMRLAGPRFEVGDALSIPSEPITAGSFQVSGDGTPTLQLADHLTVGGYPKLATVIGADLDRLAQLRPGDELRFALVEPDEAVAAARIRAEEVAAAARLAGRTDRTLDQRLRRSNLVGDVLSDGETEAERDEHP